MSEIIFWKDDCYTHFLKNDSAVVAAQEVICERINIEWTKNFKKMEWWVRKLKCGLFNEDGVRVSQAVKTFSRLELGWLKTTVKWKRKIMHEKSLWLFFANITGHVVHLRMFQGVCQHQPQSNARIRKCIGILQLHGWLKHPYRQCVPLQ